MGNLRYGLEFQLTCVSFYVYVTNIILFGIPNAFFNYKHFVPSRNINMILFSSYKTLSYTLLDVNKLSKDF